MKTLIVEDDFVARRLLQELLSPYGECDVVVNGEEAVKAFRLAWEEQQPYELICMDIMMPEVDGHEALARIREIEKMAGIRGTEEVKIIMITALGDPKSVVDAYKGGATSYIVKPFDKADLLKEIRQFGLLKRV